MNKRLSDAVYDKDFESARSFIEQGADPNYYDLLLCKAVLNQDIAIATLLLQNGVNSNGRVVNYKNFLSCNYKSSLHRATFICNLKMVKLLLKYNVDINNLDLNGNNALDVLFQLTQGDPKENFTNENRDKIIKIFLSSKFALTSRNLRNKNIVDSIKRIVPIREDNNEDVLIFFNQVKENWLPYATKQLLKSQNSIFNRAEAFKKNYRLEERE